MIMVMAESVTQNKQSTGRFIQFDEMLLDQRTSN